MSYLLYSNGIELSESFGFTRAEQVQGDFVADIGDVEMVSNWASGKTGPMYFDYESPAVHGVGPDQDWQSNLLDHWQPLFDGVKHGAPEAPLSVYAQWDVFLPFQSFGQDDAEYGLWANHIEKNLEPWIRGRADFIAPGIYPYARHGINIDDWSRECVAKIKLAQMYGLPVRPFVSHKFYDGALSGNYISKRMLDQMVSICMDMCGGLIVWGGEYPERPIWDGKNNRLIQSVLMHLGGSEIGRWGYMSEYI